jgi:molybdenum ABC transporter molybdate-binding protein
MMRARNIVLSCFAALAAATAPAHADYPVAPDVVVFCEPTLSRVVGDLGTLWRGETGIPVRVFASPTPSLLEQIAHHARDDLVIGEGDAGAAAATERQLIKPATLQRLWRNRLVVAGIAPTPNLAALAGKAPIAIVDPWAALAGGEGEKALRALGLWDAVRANAVGVVDTADASYLLATGKVRLAIIYATDVTADPAFTVTDSLPPANDGPIIYWAAETQHALSPNVARFAAFLRQPEAQARVKADGLEVLP